MSAGREEPPVGARPSASGSRRVLVVLCVTEIVSWGVLYYAFPVLAPSITAETGWSAATVTGAFSTGLVVSAVGGVLVGRWLDRYGPRWVMSGGSVLAVPAVAGLANSRSPAVFVGCWVVAGAAMSALLYPPAFAALTRWWGPRRVTALTALTLVAGLSSTVFAPLTATLSASFGWRGTYWILAGVLAVITVPAHVFGLPGSWPATEDRPAGGAAAPGPDRIARSAGFLLLAAAIGLGAFTGFAVVIGQVPLLLQRGLSTETAAWALGLGGLGQVCGRIGYRRLTSALSPRVRAAVILVGLSLTTAVLAAVSGPAGALIAAAMLAGASRGVFTLLQATAVSDRWGATHFGRLNGWLSAPAMLAIAVAPWAGAVLADELGGYPQLFWLLAVIAGVAAMLVTAART